MEDLVRWLGQQLDEEQRAAEEALKKTTTTRRRIGGQWVEDTVQPPEWRRSAWSPARVLREIDSKRKLLTQYEYVCREAVRLAQSGQEHEYWVQVGGVLQSVVLCLAAVYADRPGFREEWAP